MTLCHRSVQELTMFSRTMIAPRKGPNRVPIPPAMAISNPGTDWARDIMAGLANSLNMPCSAPATPARAPDTVKAMNRCSGTL